MLIGTNPDYRGQIPTAADAISVIEVADGSLANDRTEKLAIYAAAGIAQYVIVNLVDGVVEVDEGPRPEKRDYVVRSVLTAAGTLELLLPKDARLNIPAAELLP